MDPNDILKQMKESGFEPSEVEDSSGFKPLTGEYVAVIHKVTRQSGVSKAGKEYDFISISAQVEETVSGDKGEGRYLEGLTFSLTLDWGLPNFVNSAFTVGVNIKRDSIEDVLESAQELVGKTINVRSWVKNEFPNAKIVKEFKSSKSGKKNTEKIPF